MRGELEAYIAETYSVEAERPWAPESSHTVFRHADNRKWFAVLMNIPGEKIGLHNDKSIDVVNLKCGPILAASLHTEPGFFPAYHMNKTHWITAALDGSADADQIRWLLEISWELTASHRRRSFPGPAD
ncbi:MAG: MmcQ/YjbR family DNA-binding protein [Oscillospiraceae bacterium]|nr:MmcQ/YjbR family DNA-binding protein [Oscillospiraceae bacterium]